GEVGAMHLGEDLVDGDAERHRRAVDHIEQIGDRISRAYKVVGFERRPQLIQLFADQTEPEVANLGRHIECRLLRGVPPAARWNARTISTASIESSLAPRDAMTAALPGFARQRSH